MKHIYILQENIRANNYGIGTYIDNLLDILRKQDCLKVSLIYLRYKCEEFFWEYNYGIRCFYFPNEYKYSFSKRSTFYRDIVYVLYPYISDKDDNIFHFNLLEQCMSIEYLKKYFFNIKTCLTIHYFEWASKLNGNELHFNNIISNFLESKLTIQELYIKKAYQIESISYKKFDYILCLSDFTQETLLHIYEIPEKKIYMIHNGISYFPHISIPRNEIRKKFNYKESENILLYVGRISEAKGFTYLVEIINKLVENNKKVEFHLLIIGDGDLEWGKKLFSFTKCNISFLGKLDKKDVYHYYQLADLGIITSVNEQCSFVAIEMMMFGLPVIYPNLTGLTEFIEGGLQIDVKKMERSIVFPIQEFVNQITYLFLYKEKLLYYSKVSKQAYKINYTLDDMKKNYLSFYNNINFE